MLYGSLLVLLLPPSIVFSGLLGAGRALGRFCAFGRFLGVVWSPFAHGVSSFFPLLRSEAGKRFRRGKQDAAFAVLSQAKFVISLCQTLG
jgi:hypothetical protein